MLLLLLLFSFEVDEEAEEDEDGMEEAEGAEDELEVAARRLALRTAMLRMSSCGTAFDDSKSTKIKRKINKKRRAK